MNGTLRQVVVAAISVTMALSAPSRVPASQESGGSDVPERVADHEDRTALTLTVYSGGFVLVDDVRRVSLPAGRARLVFEDVATTLQPQTAHLRATDLRVLSQNYRFDLLDPDSLLQRFVGQRVTLVFRDTEDGDTVYRRQEATLLSARGGGVWRIGERIAVDPEYSHLEFDPEGVELRARPAMAWEVESGGGESRLTASYLADSVGWEADYVLSVVDGDDGPSASLVGWVTVDNRSGIDFPDASLRFVAGDVRRVTSAPAEPRRERVQAMAMQEADTVSRQSLSAYHIYTYDRPVDLRDGEQKQVRLLEGGGVEIEPVYRVSTRPGLFLSPEDEAVEPPVQYLLRLRNAESRGLGMPLPAGVVRAYRVDGGESRFIGEDRIQHTPVEETLTVDLGLAFDVVAERRQTEFRRIADDVHLSAQEVELRNHGAEEITVEVVERFGGSWELLESSHPPERRDAFSATFRVPVLAEGAAVLSYRVRVENR